METIQEATYNFNLGNFDKSEQIALEILKKNPDIFEAIDVISAVVLKTNDSILLKKGGFKELEIIRKVAKYLSDLKMYPHAMLFYKKSLSIEPKDYIGLNNLGLLYESMLDDEKAKLCYEKSIKIKYNFHALYNLGIYYRKQKDTQNAIKYVTKALQLKPDDAQTKYSLGMLYFTESNFEEGYKYFLQRNTKGIESLKNFWDGTPYPDKTILVFCDYGLGDAIMFSRYFSFLKDYFKNVKVVCSSKLITLFEKSFPDIEFLTQFSELDYDYCVLAMNLPYYLKMNFSKIPYSSGYLKADTSKVEQFKKKYFNTDKLKVGLFWIGGDTENRVAKNRFMALSDLQKLIDIENIQYYSLEVDDPFDDIQFYPEIIDLGKDFKDFSDTAAAIKNLDLVITIDSAVAHLAGGLGAKTYLMLPKSTEWRWFKDEKRTIWYNSVELFVQNKLYDWTFVVNEIYKKLAIV